MLAVGRVIADRFVVQQLAGEGGMGAVYRARDVRSGEDVALKIRTFTGEGDEARFEREIETLQSLAHSAIVRYVAHGTTEEGAPFLAMEWLEGEDLYARLASGGLPVRDALAITRRIASALGAAHARGIIHRDVKPTNVLLPRGDCAAAKLLDFGIARVRGAQLTRTGVVVGTPGYMAPEQVRGDRTLDARVDVFALGCVMYECFTGTPAFVADSPLALFAKLLFEPAPRLRDACPGADQHVDELVARMLSKDPAERPADGAAVLAALDEGTVTEVAFAETQIARPPAITAGERRVLSVVLVGRADDPAPPSHSTVVGVLDVRRAIDAFGARAEALADGTFVVVLEGGDAADRARDAGRCALRLHEMLPARAVVVATGRSLAGERFPIGEAIDRAASMLGRRDARGHVEIDDTTAALLGPQFLVDASDAAWHRLVAERSDDDARKVLGVVTPFVGREREVAAIDGLLAECIAEETARVALVVGRPGSGKSRLRHELVRRVRATTPSSRVWSVRADALRTGSPFAVVGDCIRQACAIAPADGVTDALPKIAAQVGKNTSRHLVELLASLAGVDVEPSAAMRAARRDPAVMTAQLGAAWDELIASACRRGPLVIVVDELQWADDASLRLIAGALRSSRERSLCLLAFSRAEAPQPLAALQDPSVVEVRLGGVSRRAAERLVRSVLGDGIAANDVAQLVARADGDPFFLEELVRGFAAGITLPETVVAMAQSRLDALDPVARRVLRAASVFGDTFWAAGVEALLGDEVGHDAVERALRTLVDREIVTASAPSRLVGHRQLRFRNALLQEAAYETLVEEDRVAAHRTAARFLYDAGEVDDAVLGEHLSLARDDRAAEAFASAAESALDRGDHASAERFAERAMREGARDEALGRTRLVQALATWDRKEGGFRFAEEAVALLPRGSSRWLRAIAQRGFADVPRELLHASLEEIESCDVEDEIAAYVARGALVQALAFMGEVRPAKRFLAEATPPDDEARLQQMRIFAVVGHLGGNWLDAANGQAGVAELAVALGREREAWIARSNEGFAWVVLGRYEQALTALDAARDHATRYGAAANVCVAYVLSALAAVRAGRPDAPAHVTRARAALASDVGVDTRAIGATRAYLAEALLEIGEPAEADGEARRAVETLATAPTSLPQALATLSRVALARGAVDEALAHAMKANAMYDELRAIEQGQISVRVSLAEALHAAGRATEAKVAIARAHTELSGLARAVVQDDVRRSFLSRVPENARTRELYARLCGHG